LTGDDLVERLGTCPLNASRCRKGAALAAKAVYVGISSWKNEGYFGQLYVTNTGLLDIFNSLLMENYSGATRSARRVGG
jgi:hypothetical protein